MGEFRDLGNTGVVDVPTVTVIAHGIWTDMITENGTRESSGQSERRAADGSPLSYATVNGQGRGGAGGRGPWPG